MFKVLKNFKIYSMSGNKTLKPIIKYDKMIELKSGSKFYGDFGLSKEDFQYLKEKRFIE